MRNKHIIHEIGKAALLGLVLVSAGAGVSPFASRAFAAEVKFSAEVDRKQVFLNESVSLRIRVQSESRSTAHTPGFQAPDFDVVNEFNSVSVESSYNSAVGRFSMINRQEITKVLQPRKPGNLTISNIQLDVDGKKYRAPDIVIEVKGGSAPATGVPSSRFAQGSRRNEDVPAEKNAGTGQAAFVRAEIDNKTAYKGQQIIVSYYLYRRTKVFNIQVDKFPVLGGFLREDLDIPVMTQRLDSERVTVGGVPFERSLLARYAAYPLQEGKLSIDSLALKFSFYGNSRGDWQDQEDPLFGFFQQMVPRAGNSQSEKIVIDVLPLPQEGKPASFGGGVGEFNIVSAVNKYEVKANEAVTLTLKLEGQGNVATVQDPVTQWPQGLELYDSKGRAQSGRNGVGEKIFEYLLIPRVPGKLEIPSLEFGFFDPAKKQYYTKKTDPIQITVLEPAPGTVVSNPNPTSSKAVAPTKPKKPEMRYIKPPEAFSSAQDHSWQPVWRIFYWAFSVLLTILLGLVVGDLLRKGRRESKRTPGLDLKDLNELAKAATNGMAWKEVLGAYDKLTFVVLDALETRYGIGAKSLSRPELKRILLEEKGMSIDLWGRIGQLLDYSDLVRFAGGGVSEEKARTELTRWVSEAEALVQTSSPERTA